MEIQTAKKPCLRLPSRLGTLGPDRGDSRRTPALTLQP
jgi:hypothetical protein